MCVCPCMFVFVCVCRLSVCLYVCLSVSVRVFHLISLFNINKSSEYGRSTPHQTIHNLQSYAFTLNIITAYIFLMYIVNSMDSSVMPSLSAKTLYTCTQKQTNTFYNRINISCMSTYLRLGDLISNVNFPEVFKEVHHRKL